MGSSFCAYSMHSLNLYSLVDMYCFLKTKTNTNTNTKVIAQQVCVIVATHLQHEDKGDTRGHHMEAEFQDDPEVVVDNLYRLVSLYHDIYLPDYMLAP